MEKEGGKRSVRRLGREYKGWERKRAERRECKGWVKKRGKKTSAINGERRKGEEMRILVQT